MIEQAGPAKRRLCLRGKTHDIKRAISHPRSIFMCTPRRNFSSVIQGPWAVIVTRANITLPHADSTQATYLDNNTLPTEPITTVNRLIILHK